MNVPRRYLLSLILSLIIWGSTVEAEPKEGKDLPRLAGSVPILVYHRFGPSVADGMTVTTAVFESHLKYLHDHGYRIIPLRELLDNFLLKGLSPAHRSVAITADDGHISVYNEALPLLKKYRIPMTLFLYPSAISKASYTLTWNHLQELKDTGLFDIQSHTYWHPNFKKEKERLNPPEFEKFVEIQFKKSKEKLEKEFQTRVDMLAWPFGIHDRWLMSKAAEAGYAAAFTIERHHASPANDRMALPRYLLTDGDRGTVWERILRGTNNQ